MTISRRQSLSRNEISTRPKAVLPLHSVSRYKSPNPNMTLPLELLPNFSYSNQVQPVQFTELQLDNHINVPTSERLMEIYQNHVFL